MQAQIESSGAIPLISRRRAFWAALRLILIVGLTLFILFLGLLTALRRPLLPSRQFVATYSIDGFVHKDAEIFTPLFMRRLYYIRLPALAGTRYEFFLADFRRHVVSKPHRPRMTPLGFRTIHSDQPFGIDLLFPKIEDTWTVSFDSSGVAFSNNTIDVKLTK
jgi:hypothetical protein